MAPLSTGKRRNVGPVTALIAAAVLSLALMTAWSVEGTNGPLHSAKNVVATIVSPFQRVGAIVATPFQAIVNGFINVSASTEELTTLEQENAELRAQLAEYEEYRLENERLTALLDMATSYNIETTGARVISRSTDSWNRTITIDKGSVDGITIGMPVMSSSGLIGQTESVAANTSVVRLITDEQSAVSVLLQNSRTEGVLTGSPDGLLYLDYISTDTEVELGEAVVTSGLGGVYPSGITVGIVSRITGDENDTYRTIVVTPLASFDINEEVIILIGDETEVTFSASVAEDQDSSSDSSSSDSSSGSSGDGDDDTTSTDTDEGGDG